MRHLILKNDIHQIPRLADFVTAIATESGLDQATTMSLNLALEEAVSNVILYAYPKGTKGVVEISANMLDDRIDFTVTDEGLPFDPTQASSPDLSLKAEERPIGGLGIYLVRNIMDQVSYTRKDGKNILLMTKNK
jgi:anti-sigma regulatory factor (Ser/Thr protein kinase)